MRSSVVEAPQQLYGLPPVIDGRSVLLILGSFPSVKSLEKREYYGHPQNHFWLLMERSFGIDRNLPYEERVQALLSNRVAVWDVIASCQRAGSADDAIEEPVANALIDLLDEHPGIARILFNGTRAEATARLQLPQLLDRPTLKFERLPSTSPRVQLQRKVEAWSHLKDWVRTDG